MFWNINRENLVRTSDNKFLGKELAQYPTGGNAITLIRASVYNSIYNYNGQMLNITQILEAESIPATYNEKTFKIDFTGTYTASNNSDLNFMLGLINGKQYDSEDSGDFVITVQNNVIYVCSDLAQYSSSIITTGISSNIIGILEFDASNGYILKADFNNPMNLKNDRGINITTQFKIWFEDARGNQIDEINNFNLLFKIDGAY